jgi:nucleotide-binding universal stress UspA family protein
MATRDAKRQYAVLVGVDYSSNGDLAIERAFDLASSQAVAHVHVVHAQNLSAPASYGANHVPGSEFDELSRQLLTHIQAVLKRWCTARSRAAPFLQLSTHVRTETPAEAIAQLATDLEADLIVLGTHSHRGVRRSQRGSVVEKIVRLAPCAVLVVPPMEPPMPPIEPACESCLESRRITGGAEFWCARHSERQGRRHTFHYRTAPGELHSSLFPSPLTLELSAGLAKEASTHPC